MTFKSLTISTDTLPAWMIAEQKRAEAEQFTQDALQLEAPSPRFTTWAADDFEEEDDSFTLQF